MPDPPNESLEYAPRRRGTPPGTVYAWFGLAVLLFQIVWILPYAFFENGVLGDGLAKQPWRDFLIYMGEAAPALCAIGLSLLHIQVYRRRGGLFRHCILSIVVIIIGLLLVAISLKGWYQDDVIERSMPHGLW
jgi:hypothetical protein